MNAREHAVKVSLSSDELARLDRARGRTERAVYLRTLLSEPPKGDERSRPTMNPGHPLPIGARWPHKRREIVRHSLRLAGSGRQRLDRRVGAPIASSASVDSRDR